MQACMKTRTYNLKHLCVSYNLAFFVRLIVSPMTIRVIFMCLIVECTMSMRHLKITCILWVFHLFPLVALCGILFCLYNE